VGTVVPVKSPASIIMGFSGERGSTVRSKSSSKIFSGRPESRKYFLASSSEISLREFLFRQIYFQNLAMVTEWHNNTPFSIQNGFAV